MITLYLEISDSVAHNWIKMSTSFILQFPSQSDRSFGSQHTRGRSFDGSPSISANKLINNARGSSDNKLLKSFSVDSDKANNVAKIKVVVCSVFVHFKRKLEVRLFHELEIKNYFRSLIKLQLR